LRLLMQHKLKREVKMNLPYSPVKKVGSWYFISGQVGKDMETNLAQKDMTEQTKQLFANLDAALKLAGLSKTYIVKTTVFLVDMGDFAAMNEVYQTYFTEPYPARSTVAVKELPRIADKPLLVEIEAVAYKDPDE
jgi:2-iminobutanoate/2-iminopropanoate deaminase